MQKDFHYCCIKYLASSAGFEENDAQVIAYASQYVDDATEHKGIFIDNVPEVAQDLVKDGKFEPTCTAHKGIQALEVLKREVQRKVYIPFHFVPAERYADAGRYDYRARPGSPFARSLVENAAGFCKSNKGDQGVQSLVKLGISLHTFADTWSHHRFSGRRSATDNDIERIRLLSGDEWKRPDWPEILYNLLPDVGHAEALRFPDQSHLSWRYEHDESGINITRENTEEFLDAAGEIYRVLCDVRGASPNWKPHVEDVRYCFGMKTDSVKIKFKTWRDRFPGVRFDYDPKRWRTEALKGDWYDWDHFQSAKDFETLHYSAKEDLKWFFFHVEARNQRMEVVNHIRRDLL